MGALHRGHGSLISRSAAELRPENGLTVVSVFVNPIQFEDRTDLERYPRTLDADRRLCEEAGADIIFAPTAREIYPDGFSSFVDMEGEFTQKLCGRARPGHFRGVLTVVCKLFHIVGPTRAYFGEKDAQQLFLLKKMAYDLDMDIRIVGCPTVRETDGLALSSRNARLAPQERAAAGCLIRALKEGQSASEDRLPGTAGTARAERAASVRASLIAAVEGEPSARLDYAELLDAETFGPVTDETGRVLLAVAAFFGETRLIDNVIADVGSGGKRDESR
jgi:pantoate--beta-alanine ligase